MPDWQLDLIEIEVSDNISWKVLRDDHSVSFINIQDVTLEEPPKPPPPAVLPASPEQVRQQDTEEIITEIIKYALALFYVPVYLLMHSIALWPLWLLILLVFDK